MSWRSNAQRTGANESGLANPRRWGGGGNDGGYGGSPPPPQHHYNGGGGGGGGGGYDSHGYPGPPSQQAPPPPPPSGAGGASDLVGPGGERKRKSRWGDEKDKVQVAGLPSAIAGNVNARDLELYAVHVRLEEIARKLKSGDVVPPERERSPSPPPTYDHHGRRTNTREIRYKRKLEDERNRLVEKAMKADPSFKPPTEYLMHKRMSGRPSEKIYLPVKEFPEIKWIGLILGPRGNSLKNMERETGAKIVIRGKGSTKEGKGNFGSRSQDEDDELHCNITADSQDKVDACAKLINKVIATAASTPDEQNDHKRNQLRELAMLNGTLRDDENQPCQNCGKLGHRKYDCPEQRNFTANVVCRNCGNMGHMARDCIAHRNKPGGAGSQTTPQFDSEYSALMAELGEAPPPGMSNGGGGLGSATPSSAAGGPGFGTPVGAAGSGGASGGQPLSSVTPPWRIASNWHPPQPDRPPREREPRRDNFHHGGGGYHHQQRGPYHHQQQQHYQQHNPYGGGAGGGYGAPPQAGYGQPQPAGGYDYSAYYAAAGGAGAAPGANPYAGAAGYGASYA